jgi:hypothetical protein
MRLFQFIFMKHLVIWDIIQTHLSLMLIIGQRNLLYAFLRL